MTLTAEGGTADVMRAAEEGYFEFADKPDDRLTGRLAELHRENGAPRKAEDLLWRNFVQRPDMRSFDLLVRPLAAKARKGLEQRAIAHLDGLRQK